jgi:hypothetical protein
MPDEADPAALLRWIPQHLDPNARREVERYAEERCKRVLEEADRLAAARDEGTGSDPITPADITRAARYLDSMPGIIRPSIREYFFQGTSYVAAVVAGYFVNHMDVPWGSIGFAVVLSLGVVSFALGLRDRKRGRR